MSVQMVGKIDGETLCAEPEGGACGETVVELDEMERTAPEVVGEVFEVFCVVRR